MEDFSKFLGSWIALRLLNGTKWIGILKDVDWEKSKLFLVKAHEMVLASGEKEPRLLPFGSKVFSGGDIHDLTLLMPEAVPQNGKDGNSHSRAGDHHAPFPSPKTPAQKKGEKDDMRIGSPHRKHDVLDAQKAWQAAAMAMMPNNPKTSGPMQPCQSKPSQTLATGQGSLKSKPSTQAQASGGGSSNSNNPQQSQNSGQGTWGSAYNTPDKSNQSAAPSSGSAVSVNRPNPHQPAEQQHQPAADPQIQSQPLAGHVSVAANSTPSLQTRGQQLTPETMAACRQFIAQLAGLTQPVSSVPAQAVPPAASSLLTMPPPPAVPLPHAGPPVPPNANLQQMAMLQQLQQAMQLQQLQQQAQMLLQPQSATAAVPNPPAINPFAALEVLLKLQQQQQPQQQPQLQQQQNNNPILAALQRQLQMLQQPQEQQQQQQQTAPKEGSISPQLQVTDDLTPVRTGRPSAKTPRAADKTASASPLASGLSPRTAGRDADAVKSHNRASDQDYNKYSSCSRGSSSGSAIKSKHSVLADPPAGPSSMRSPRPSSLSTRQARQLLSLNDFVAELVEEARQHTAKGGMSHAQKAKQQEQVDEAISWLMDLGLELEESLKKLWEWVGLGLISFPKFEALKIEFLAADQGGKQDVLPTEQPAKRGPGHSKSGHSASGSKPPVSPLSLHSRSPRSATAASLEKEGSSSLQTGSAKGLVASPYARVRGGSTPSASRVQHGPVHRNLENIPPTLNGCSPRASPHAASQPARPATQPSPQPSPGLMDAMAHIRILPTGKDAGSDGVGNKTGTPAIARPVSVEPYTATATTSLGALSLNHRLSAASGAPACQGCLSSTSKTAPDSPLAARPSPIRILDLQEHVQAIPAVPRSRIIKSIPPLMPHTNVEGTCNLALSVGCYTEMGLPLEIAQGLYECGVRNLGGHQRQLLVEMQALMKSTWSGGGADTAGVKDTSSKLQVTCLKTPSGPGTTATTCAHLLHQVLLHAPYPDDVFPSVHDYPSATGELHPLALVLCPTRTEAEDMGDLARALAYHCGVPVHTAVGGTKIIQQRRDQQDEMGYTPFSLVIGTTGRVLDMLRRGRLNVSRVRVMMLMESAALAGTSDFQAQAQLLMPKLAPSLQQVLLLTPTELLPTVLSTYEQVIFSSNGAAIEGGHACSPACSTTGSEAHGVATSKPSVPLTKLNPNAPAFATHSWAKFCPQGDPSAAPRVASLSASSSLEVAPSATTLVVNQLNQMSCASTAGGKARVSKSLPPLVSLVLFFVGDPDAPLSVILQPVKTKPAPATINTASADMVDRPALALTAAAHPQPCNRRLSVHSPHASGCASSAPNPNLNAGSESHRQALCSSCGAATTTSCSVKVEEAEASEPGIQKACEAAVAKLVQLAIRGSSDRACPLTVSLTAVDTLAH